MSHAGVTGSAVFSFDDDGQVTRVTAQRYLGGGASARLETWTIPITEWKTFGGLRVPARGHVIWKLPAGDFDYYRWEIASLESTELRAERASGAQLAPRKPFAQPHASSSQRRGGHGT